MRPSHYRGNYRGRRWKGDISQMDPIARRCIKEYVMNLLGVHDLTQCFLEFAVFLLNRDSRRFLRDFILKARRKAGHGDEEEMLARAHRSLDFDDLANLIRNTVEDDNSKVSRRKIEDILAKLVDGQDVGRNRSKSAETRLKNLQDLFKLTRGDVAVLCFMYCRSQVKPLDSLCEGNTFWGLTKLMATASNLRSLEVRKSLSLGGNLWNSGIIGKELHFPELQLLAEIVDYLNGVGEISLVQKYCRRDKGRSLDLDSFTVPEHSTEIIRSLLKAGGPCHILLHGEPGTGKTEFSRAVAAAAGKEVFFVQMGETRGEIGRATASRRAAIKGAVGAVKPGHSVLVVDEADHFLNTRYFMFGCENTQEKGWLNNFLDHCGHKIIWIVNESAYIEESTLRRFSYSLRFKKFTRIERQSVWEKMAGRHPLRRHLSPSLLKELAGRYQANAAGIASALNTLKAITPNGRAEPDNVKRTLSELLERHLEATGHDTRQKLNILTDRYDATALNTDVSPERILHSLKAHSDSIANNNEPDRRHVNLLFWGPPGTGKTEFAKYLSDRLSVGLLVKRSSDLRSCWVGETEKLIRDAFDEAERDRAILFIDEADSMFINRDTAVRSWETSQTNELLTQMENFRGILICCTNLLDHLDRAVMRRFAWKIQFKALTVEGRRNLYEKYFCEAGNKPGNMVVKRLAAAGDLTAGDFRTVWEKLRFSGERQDDAAALTALEQEVMYRDGGRSIVGFGNP